MENDTVEITIKKNKIKNYYETNKEKIEKTPRVLKKFFRK